MAEGGQSIARSPPPPPPTLNASPPHAGGPRRFRSPPITLSSPAALANSPVHDPPGSESEGEGESRCRRLLHRRSTFPPPGIASLRRSPFAFSDEDCARNSGEPTGRGPRLRRRSGRPRSLIPNQSLVSFSLFPAFPVDVAFHPEGAMEESSGFSSGGGSACPEGSSRRRCPSQISVFCRRCSPQRSRFVFLVRFLRGKEN